jgi:4-azaleucine resistance transporter AzlC
MDHTHSTRRSEFLAGMKDTIPMVIGAIPFGIIFGVTAVASTNGEPALSPEGTIAMSTFVFAGSSQFIASRLVAERVGLLLIILTTFIVNLRHALYSASLAPYMRHLSQRWLLPLGFWLTDETYAVVIRRYTDVDGSPHKHWYHLGSSVFMYANWQLCTIIGIVAGRSIPDAQGWGLDFAMSVTFIGIVVPLIRSRPMLVAALVAGVSALVFNDMPNNSGLMVASALGILAGYLAETYAPARQEPGTQDTEQKPAQEGAK